MATTANLGLEIIVDGTSPWGDDARANNVLVDTLLTLRGNGDPNGSVVGTFLTQQYRDEVSGLLWYCTLAGDAGTATWVAVSQTFYNTDANILALDSTLYPGCFAYATDLKWVRYSTGAGWGIITGTGSRLGYVLKETDTKTPGHFAGSPTSWGGGEVDITLPSTGGWRIFLEAGLNMGHDDPPQSVVARISESLEGLGNLRSTWAMSNPQGLSSEDSPLLSIKHNFVGVPGTSYTFDVEGAAGGIAETATLNPRGSATWPTFSFFKGWYEHIL